VKLGATVTTFIKFTFFGASATFSKVESFGSHPEFKIDYRYARNKKDEGNSLYVFSFPLRL